METHFRYKPFLVTGFVLGTDCFVCYKATLVGLPMMTASSTLFTAFATLNIDAKSLRRGGACLRELYLAELVVIVVSSSSLSVSHR